MGILDFVKSDEKRSSSPEDEVNVGGQTGEIEEVGDDLHRGMKPRQLSELIQNPLLMLDNLEDIKVWN